MTSILARAEIRHVDAPRRPLPEVAAIRMAAPAAVLMSVLTAGWTILLIVAPNPPAGANPADILRFIAAHDGWQILSFILVVPIALLHVPVWLGLAALTWRARPAAAMLAITFGLLYAPFTAWAYWTQLTVIRGLADLQRTAQGDAEAAYRVLGFTSEQWSVAYSTDVLGYGIWGIAALATAIGLLSRPEALARITGAAFAVAGLLTSIWAVGFVARNTMIDSIGALGSGLVALVAMVLSAALLLRARGGRQPIIDIH